MRSSSANLQSYHPGKAPKEHEEMGIIERLEARDAQREAEAERSAKESKEEAASLRKKDDEWRSISDKRSRSSFSLSVTALICSIVMAIISPVVSEGIKRSMGLGVTPTPPSTKSDEEIREFIRQELKSMTPEKPGKPTLVEDAK